MKVCKQCGQAVQDVETFCPRCGSGSLVADNAQRTAQRPVPRPQQPMNGAAAPNQARQPQPAPPGYRNPNAVRQPPQAGQAPGRPMQAGQQRPVQPQGQPGQPQGQPRPVQPRPQGQPVPGMQQGQPQGAYRQAPRPAQYGGQPQGPQGQQGQPYPNNMEAHHQFNQSDEFGMGGPMNAEMEPKKKKFGFGKKKQQTNPNMVDPTMQGGYAQPNAPQQAPQMGNSYGTPYAPGNDVVTIKEWLFTFLKLMIPIYNIIFIIQSWKGRNGVKESVSNYIKAYLIIMAISFALVMIISIGFGAVITSLIMY